MKWPGHVRFDRCVHNLAHRLAPASHDQLDPTFNRNRDVHLPQPHRVVVLGREVFLGYLQRINTARLGRQHYFLVTPRAIGQLLTSFQIKPPSMEISTLSTQEPPPEYAQPRKSMPNLSARSREWCQRLWIMLTFTMDESVVYNGFLVSWGQNRR